MKKLQLFLACSLFAALQNASAQSSVIIKNYIETYKEIAIEEMIRTGVPASIKLAQGIHETAAGQSVLVTKSNNHFGIKCKTGWQGASVSHDDDARGECFRKYDSPFESFKDHSEFLRTRSHYAFLFNLDPTDFEAWAHGLKKAGYATNPKYPQIIIKLIKDYNLQDYSLIALGKLPAANEGLAYANKPATVKTSIDKIDKTEKSVKKIINYPTGVFRINETQVVFVPKGTSYFSVAQQHNIPLARLFDFNDMKAQEETSADCLIYLQRKRRTGKSETRKVEHGESLYDIAQEEGIRLQSLLELNQLKENVAIQEGEILHLQRESTSVPKILASMFKPVSNTDYNNTQPQYPVESYLVHVVESKETLYSISKKYTVTTEDLLKWNNLHSSDLKIGQQLRINKTIHAANKTSR
jgi:LysM repeat protein